MLERVGVKAVIEGLNPYLAGIGRLNSATESTGAAAAKASLGTRALAVAMGLMNAAVTIGIPALLAVGGAMAKAITDTVSYGKAVRDLGRSIGATAEESSKLISAADDVTVSVESLRAGLLAAIRNGISPTIEGLGRLADQYVAIHDPIARTKFLTDNFGRSGADLAPLMELGASGIRSLGNEAWNTGQVLSGPALDSLREYEIALDSTQDAAKGLEMALGLAAGPAATSFLQFATRAITNLRDLRIEALTLPAALTGLRNFFTGMAEDRALQGPGLKLTGDLISQRDRLARGGQDLVRYNDILAYSYGRLSTAQGALKVAQENLAAAQKAAGSIAQESAGIVDRYTSRGSKRQIDALEIIDRVSGTHYAEDEKRLKREDQLYRDFAAKRITGAQYEAGLQAEKDAMIEPYAAAEVAAQEAVNNIQAYINSIQGKTVRVVIKQVCSGYMCPSVQEQISTATAEALGLGQRAAGGALSGADLVGEHGIEAVVNGVVIPTAMTRAMLAQGLLQPKARHAAGGFIDPASMALPLQQGMGGAGQRVGIGTMNVSVSTEISRMVFLDALRRAVQ